MKGYYIYDDVGKPIKIEQIKVDNKQVEKAKPSKIIYALLSVLCVACLLLGGALISLKNDYQERLDEQEKIVSDIGELLINGVPVKLKGVNRHDSHPEYGYCTAGNHHILSGLHLDQEIGLRITEILLAMCLEDIRNAHTLALCNDLVHLHHVHGK